MVSKVSFTPFTLVTFPKYSTLLCGPLLLLTIP